MRAAIAGVCAVLLVAPARAGEDPVAQLLGTKAERESTAPDPNWQPRPGLRAGVLIEGALGCPTRSMCEDAIKAGQASDSLGASRVPGVPLAKGTPVLVLSVSRPEMKPLPRPPAMTGEQVRQLAQAEFSRVPDPNPWPLEVRVLEGPARDQVVYMSDRAIGVVIQRQEPRQYLRRGKKDRLLHQEWDEWFLLRRPKGKPGGKTGTLQARSLYRLGERLERAGDEDGAVGAYWFTLRDFEGTQAARDAAKRLLDMGLRRMPDGTLEFDPRLSALTTKRR